MVSPTNNRERGFFFYRLANRVPWPGSFTGKLMMVAFIGVHAPLIATVIYAVARMGEEGFPVGLTVVCLAATLAGTALTLWVQSRLLAPVNATSHALKAFAERQTLPDLPTGFSDEVGVLMEETQNCLTRQARLLELKNRTFRTLSHDLRSPLSGIVDACALLRLPGEDLDDAERTSIVDSIETVATEQLEMVEALLRLAIAETGRDDVALTSVPVDELIGASVDQATPAARIRKLSLCAQETPPALTVHAERRLLRQILNNLISNALKNTPNGGSVIVGAEVDGEMAKLFVQDTGPGLSEAQLERINAGGGLTSNQDARGEKSVGLGLRICHDCARFLGAQLRAENVTGGGSRFTVTLPRSG